MSLKNTAGKKITVKVKKVDAAKGYQIVFATNKSFKNSRSTTISKTSKTVTNLKKNRTYYVKVRAYKVDSAGKKSIVNLVL